MLGFTIPQLILFLAAFALYLVKPAWLMPLWLITEPILAPFMVLFSGIGDYEEQLHFVWGLWAIYNRLFLLILIIEIIKGHRVMKSLKPLFLPILVLCLYFVIHNLVTHFFPLTILRESVFVLYSILPLLVFLYNKELWPSLKLMFWCVLVVVIIQIVFIPFNLSGVFAYSGRYEELINQTTESTLVSGSFIRSSSLADYLAIVYLFVSIDFFVRKSHSPFLFLILSILIIVPLIFAGSKLPIIVTFINLALCIINFYRKKIFSVAMVSLLILGVLALFVNTNPALIRDNDGLNRLEEGIGGIFNSKTRKNTLGESTVSISYDLINRYFYQSPLVGHGNSFNNNENAYPNTFSMDVPALISDAALAYYLVEYGIIGLLLFLAFHYSVLKFGTFPFSSNNRKIVTLLLFVFFVLFAVTERGLFNRANFIYFFAYVFGVARNNEEKNETEKMKMVLSL